MPATTCDNARQYLEGLQRLAGQVDPAAIDAYTQHLFLAWQEEHRVFIFGNGGSASTASHHVLDLLKTAALEGRRHLRAISLVDNYGLTTAIGNDLHFDDTFRYPLAAYAEPGDLAVAISCSGNSPNVVRACEWARERSMVVIALTGFTGGRLRALADVEIHVPSDNYGLIEDIHLSVGHIAAQSLKARILKEGQVPSCTF